MGFLEYDFREPPAWARILVRSPTQAESLLAHYGNERKHTEFRLTRPVEIESLRLSFSQAWAIKDHYIHEAITPDVQITLNANAYYPFLAFLDGLERYRRGELYRVTRSLTFGNLIYLAPDVITNVRKHDWIHHKPQVDFWLEDRLNRLRQIAESPNILMGSQANRNLPEY